VQVTERLVGILARRDGEIIARWLDLQPSGGIKWSAAEQHETARQSREFMELLKAATRDGSVEDMNTAPWTRVKDFLSDFSTSYAKRGYSPSETASFIFSLKQPLFTAIREDAGNDSAALGPISWISSAFSLRKPSRRPVRK
jgi:rsbT co-antagonist protein RsbR